jgi:hypothetical protein
MEDREVSGRRADSFESPDWVGVEIDDESGIDSVADGFGADICEVPLMKFVVMDGCDCMVARVDEVLVFASEGLEESLTIDENIENSELEAAGTSDAFVVSMTRDDNPENLDLDTFCRNDTRGVSCKEDFVRMAREVSTTVDDSCMYSDCETVDSWLTYENLENP